MPDTPTKNKIARNAALFGGLALALILLDRLTKAWAGQNPEGTLLGIPLPGILQFRVVHNTGAAWGMFGDSTFALGVFSLAFCLALVILAHLRREKASSLEMIGYGLVLGGGIGNAIDRFSLGYVIDFIEAAFIDFPVFNIADIGVTCGFALVVLAILLSERGGEV